MKLLIPFIFLLFSCSKIDVKRKAAWKSWEGRSTDELKNTPILKI